MIIKIKQPDSAELLAQTRASAYMTRIDFCIAMARAGVLTHADAVASARGAWPEAMATFLDYLDAEQRLDAQIEWAACDTVQRMHPFMLSLASWLGMSDEDVDAIFGVTL